jgi:hypothetical protein
LQSQNLIDRGHVRPLAKVKNLGELRGKGERNLSFTFTCFSFSLLLQEVYMVYKALQPQLQVNKHNRLASGWHPDVNHPKRAQYTKT